MRRGRAVVRRAAASLGLRADRRSAAIRRSLTNGLTVFVFHEITDSPSEFQLVAQGYTPPAQFERQIGWIGERFQFIPPSALPQLGGTSPLPQNAALITFDDAWAGVFSVGLPLLHSLGVPALCFLNMATITGMPDLGAVRRYELREGSSAGPKFGQPVDARTAPAVLEQVKAAYGENPDFVAYQGAIARLQELETAAREYSVWFGSHLYHHWDIASISERLFVSSLEDNARALARFDNALAVFATPYGRPLSEARVREARAFARVIFTATGTQNADVSGIVLDRLMLAPEPSGPSEWWWSTHRKRLFGPLAA
jgi:peptidoglycan/xylan/chitin deacetylase (PgdA/CDA1 family)